MKPIKYIKSLKNRWADPYRKSYSQSGEDLIASFLLQGILKVPRPTYLDIGANHPVHINNTYYFYNQGCRGVCIEPNPDLAALFGKKRPRDTCINAGVAVSSKETEDFYILKSAVLSTFSKKDADDLVNTAGETIKKTVKIPLMNVNEVLKKYCASSPNYVSLDIEGLDLEVLRSWDFASWRPEVLVIETLTFSERKKVSIIYDMMKANGYLLYADTYINSIFVDAQSWRNMADNGDLILRF